MSGRGGRGTARRAVERARLVKLTRAAIVVIAAASLIDAAGGSGASGGSPRSDGGEASATTAPPGTLVPLPSTPGVAPVISRVETTDPVIFLTIDDGHTRTPEVLDAFRDADVPASLFLLDGPVEADAGFFRAMPDTTVEGHTSNHPDLRGLSDEQQRLEICGNVDVLESAFGRRPRLLRPPYGVYDDATTRAAASCGVAALVLWEVSLNGLVVSYRSVPRLRAGDIVLMHFRPTFATELKVITDLAERSGLRFAQLEDYLAVG